MTNPLTKVELGALRRLEEWREGELPPYRKIEIVCAALRRLSASAGGEVVDAVVAEAEGLADSWQKQAPVTSEWSKGYNDGLSDAGNMLRIMANRWREGRAHPQAPAAVSEEMVEAFKGAFHRHYENQHTTYDENIRAGLIAALGGTAK